MFPITIPAFGEAVYSDHQANATSRVIHFPHAAEENWISYCGLLEEKGFLKKESVTLEYRRYAAYQGDQCGVFLSFFPYTGELQIVIEEECSYFSFADISKNMQLPAQITQVHLEDFGMSYAIRLSDGRFIVIDGGREFEADAQRLYECLKEGSPYEKPVIAAWIFTHSHEDHYYCYCSFVDMYRENVMIEKLLFNFPEADDTRHYPGLLFQDPRFDKPYTNQLYIGYLWERIRAMGTPVYMPHTGQSFRIGDAEIEILASMDDTIHCSANMNAASLAFLMKLGGQTIFWTGDASFGDERIPERYGNHLKADILQVPHHGFGSGSAEEQIRGYELIRPEVCFLPADRYIAYTSMVPFDKGSRHLMTRMGIREMICGEKTRTITLPYTAHPAGAYELEHNYLTGQDDAGARTWVFMGLNTARKEDFVFRVLNPSSAYAEIDVELFFENNSGRIRFIKFGLGECHFQNVCIIDPEQVKTETLYFNPDSLGIKGIPENAEFAVRFLSNIPIVVSHRDHAAAYHSSVN